MPTNPPPGTQRVIPYLRYRDAPAAIDFLTRAFGFVERMRMPAPDGDLMHAEVALGDNVLMLASACDQMNTKAPMELPAAAHLVMCYVDDVDAHCARARAEGATITAEPTDKFYGDRTYGATDPEGHRWYFATHVRDVSREEMEAAMRAMAAHGGE